jgi:hypothetical protein
MNGDTVATIEAGRLEFSALMSRPAQLADLVAREMAPAVLPATADEAPEAIAAPDWHEDDGETYHEAPAAAGAAQAVPVQTLAEGWRLMSARFASRCGSCGGYLAAGDAIVYRKGEKARHPGCGPVAPVAAPVTVAAPAAEVVADPARPGWNDWTALPGYVAAVQQKAAPKPVGKGRTQKAARKAQAGAGGAIGFRAVPPVAWEDDAF